MFAIKTYRAASLLATVCAFSGAVLPITSVQSHKVVEEVKLTGVVPVIEPEAQEHWSTDKYHWNHLKCICGCYLLGVVLVYAALLCYSSLEGDLEPSPGHLWLCAGFFFYYIWVISPSYFVLCLGFE